MPFSCFKSKRLLDILVLKENIVENKKGSVKAPRNNLLFIRIIVSWRTNNYKYTYSYFFVLCNTVSQRFDEQQKKLHNKLFRNFKNKFSQSSSSVCHTFSSQNPNKSFSLQIFLKLFHIFPVFPVRYKFFKQSAVVFLFFPNFHTILLFYFL